MNKLKWLSIVIILISFIVSLTIKTNALDEKSTETTPKRIMEVVNKRSLYAKHFLNEDGTYTAKIHLRPIHYKDMNGNLLDIDFDIKRKKVDNFEFSIEKNNYSILFNEKNKVSNKIITTNKKGIEKWIYFKMEDVTPMSSNYSKNKFKFNNVKDNIDIEYEVTPVKLKENIVIKNPVDNYSFNFLVDHSENLKLVLDKNEIFVYDNSTDEVLYTIEKPYAEDSKGAKTKKVLYEIKYKDTNKGRVTYLTVNLNDESFIKNAEFPIIIDPTININSLAYCKTWQSGYDTFSHINRIIIEDDEEHIERWERHAGLKFDLNIPANSVVLSADLYLYIKSIVYSKGSDYYNRAVEVYNVLNYWNNSSPEPTKGKKITSKTYGKSNNRWIKLDITTAVFNWVKGITSNYGLLLENKEISSWNYAKCEFGDLVYGPEPYIIVNYSPYENIYNTIEACKTWGTDDYKNGNYVDQIIVKHDTRSSIQGEKHAGIRFNLDSIPSNATILDAKLWMKKDSVSVGDGNDHIYYKYITQHWDNSSAHPSMGSLIGRKKYNSWSNSGNIWLDFDLTSAVQNWINGTVNNNGIIFVHDYFYGEDCEVRFVGSQSHYAPYMEIQYNILPELNIISTIEGYYFTENDINYSPTISILDQDNDTLTCKYYINSETIPRDVKTVSNTETPKTVSFASLNMGLLSEGKNTMRFTIDDGFTDTVEQIVTFYVDKYPPVLETVNVTSTASSIVITGSATDSISDMHSYPYRYTVGSTTTPWQTNTSYTKNLLTPNTLYQTKFEARDAVGHISKSNFNIYTKAETPSLNIDNETSYTLDVNILDNNPSNTLYQIKTGTLYVSSTGTLTSTPVWITLPDKHITVKSLNPNTTYNFWAKAKSNSGIQTSQSLPTSGKTLIPPPGIPLNLRITSTTQNSISLAWDQVSGASGYDIKADGQIIDNGSVAVYVHSGLQSDTQHTYQVRAKNIAGYSNWSSQLTVNTLVEVPGIPLNIVTTSSDTSIAISWDSLHDATGYKIEVDGNILDNGLVTSFLHNSLTPGTQHNYRIKAYNSGGQGAWSSIVTGTTKLNVPSGITTESQYRSIEISWNSVVNAASYDIKVDGNIIDNGPGTTYIHTGLKSGTSHTYSVRAKNSVYTGQWSPILTVDTLKSSYQFDCSVGEEILISLKANGLKNINQRVFSVEYNDFELDVIDLCTMTKTNETGTGVAVGTNINIIQSDWGMIRFTVDIDIPQNEKWTGTVNSIKFKSNIDGLTNIKFIIE